MPEHVLVAAFVSAAAGFAALSAFALQMARRHRERFERTVDRSLRGAFLFVDPGSIHRMSMLLSIVITLVAWVLSANPIVAIVAALAAGALPGLAVARIRRQHVEAFRQQIPDLLMLIAGALRAGNGLAQALAGAAAEIAPPARQELALMLREQRLGASLAESLAGLQRRLRVEETALFASALRIGTESGGNVADALESLADATRRKLAIEGKIRALTAQGRLQAWVMAMLPAGIAALLGAFDPEAMRPLLADWRGWVVCMVVALMQVAGFLTIRRLVAIEI
ncbi:type II secretion system F family protein [Zeimonas arvi]|uniref:Pilus assembly protein n=1 Tax=Zeimonas arvi TaxID=2498847 RepID=A0A5C8NY53_9BURK|nr:type II secretion system F family protein [Zeimonas arvi]TXL65992.1 pilus assembly protein [Zeimonas arvi]